MSNSSVPVLTEEARARLCPRYAVRHSGGTYALNKSPFIIGRAPDSDLVLRRGVISRRHAALIEDGTGVRLEDLESHNGIIVNGARITGKGHALVPGDTFTLGNERFELIHLGNEAFSAGNALARGWSEPPAPYVQERDLTHALDGLELYLDAVDDSLEAGKHAEAEHSFSTQVLRRLDEAIAKRSLQAESAQAAARTALRLVEVTRKGHFLNVAIRVYSEIAEPMPLPIIIGIQALLRTVVGVDRALLHTYVTRLRASVERLGVEERFLLERLEGLERLASIVAQGAESTGASARSLTPPRTERQRS